MTTRFKGLSALFVSVLAALLFSAPGVASALVLEPAPASSAKITVDSGKLVKGGAEVMLSGTYTCAGTAADLYLEVDQKGHAKGKNDSQGQPCREGATKKFKVTVPADKADSASGLYLNAGAWINARLCSPGSFTILASVNVFITFQI